MGHTSPASTPYSPKFSKYHYPSNYFNRLSTISFAAYLVREEHIKQTIDILNKREYINVAEYARKHNVKQRTLIDQ